MNLKAAAVLFAFSFPAAAHARDLCYKGTLQFNPHSISRYTPAGGPEYFGTMSRRETTGSAKYDLLLKVDPETRTGTVSLKRNGADTEVSVEWTTRGETGTAARGHQGLLPLSRLFPDRENIALKEACTRCMDAYLVQADGKQDVAVQLDNRFNLNYRPTFTIAGIRGGYAGPEHDPGVLFDYEVRYCDDGSGYFEYELHSCSKEHGLCRVTNVNTKWASVVQVQEGVVAAIAATLPSSSEKETFATQGLTFNLNSFRFNRAFTSEKALPEKAVERLGQR
ncbi:MAG: hypothetical protein HY078_12455 [Elusimicrobia bacterium]|nr:hypothetical protein [Elusimicrobiota bacterium]